MTLTFGGGISIGPGITITLPITATAGATTSVSVIQNTAIASFSPFASVINGVQPYTYFVSSGTLPTGITINSSTGLVSGTPTVTYSTANVTFSVKDSNEVIAETTSTVAFTVNAPLSAVAGATTTVSGYQNSAITNFNAFSSVTGGFTPYVYSVSSGTLPAGITLNSSTGQVSGTPNATYTTANVVFRVTDAQGTQASTTATVSFTVNAALTATAGATTTVSATQNVAITSFNPFSSVTGGFTPYTYFVSSGTLPTGITINPSTGLVSGTPTTVQGAANVTFSVRDVNNVTAATTRTVSFAVTSPPTYTIQYLVVAGGGGSLSYGGQAATGGGGGGGVLANSLSVTGGTTFTITVGAGGAKDVYAIGSPSSFIGGASNVYTYGGGYGFYNNSSPVAGTGGSGAGAGVASGGLTPRSYTADRAFGSPAPGVAGPQGYPGGAGNQSVTWPAPALFFVAAAGGGGGGGATGNTGTTNPTAATGGPGGAGRLWPYTNNYYAGGGGGGAANGGPGPSYTASGGAGGLGGGGAGVASNGATAGSGISGTGGGAGGTGGPSGAATGGAGGGGIVILAVPTPNYPGSAPGATVTTPPAAPGMTVLTYASSGSYTA